MRIETERLIIREFIRSDIDLIFNINNDPECIKFNGWDSMSMEKCREVLDKWINNYTDSPLTGVYCVENKTDKSKIGMAFIVKTEASDQYEIGFRLRRIYWSMGYAKEITRGFIRYAECELGASALVAEVYKTNEKSTNVFEKLNFAKSIHPDGEDGLVFKYEFTKADLIC